MGNMTQMDAQAFQNFANALENFMQNVETHCNTLESGISGCQKFMQDANSKKILQDGQQVCIDIRACLKPSQMLLEHVRSVVQVMNSGPEM